MAKMHLAPTKPKVALKVVAGRYIWSRIISMMTLGKIFRNAFIAALVLFFLFTLSYAKETSTELSQDLEKSMEPEVRGNLQLEKILKERSDFADKYGTTFAFLLNSQIQSILYSKRNEGNSRASWYYNLALEQRIWKDAFVHAELEGGHNKGIDKILPSFSVFNSDAGEVSYAYIAKLYLNQDLLEKKLSLTAGKMDLSDWVHPLFSDDNLHGGTEEAFQPYEPGSTGQVPSMFQ